MVEELKSDGHADPFEYSPRQLLAYHSLAVERKRREKREQYLISRAAYHADETGDKEMRGALDG